MTHALGTASACSGHLTFFCGSTSAAAASASMPRRASTASMVRAISSRGREQSSKVCTETSGVNVAAWGPLGGYLSRHVSQSNTTN